LSFGVVLAVVAAFFFTDFFAAMARISSFGCDRTTSALVASR